MRSSVSVIVSSPPLDTSMSYPDYQAHPHHHQSLLVLVKQVGSQLKSRSFRKLYERINRVSNVKVNDTSGNTRPVWVTYRKDYPVDNNDWGDFQAHRRVLGIITVGHVGSQSDLNDVCKQHESLKVKYSSTLYDSRCIILGLNPDGSVFQSNQSNSGDSSPQLANCSEINDIDSEPVNGHSPIADRDSGVYETPLAERHRNGDLNSHRSINTCEYNAKNSKDSKVYVNGTQIGRIKANSAGSDSGSESTCEYGLEDLDKTDAPGNCHSSTNCSINNSFNSNSSFPNSTDSSMGAPDSKVLLQPPNCFKTRALFYPTWEHAVNIEAQVQDFINSLFWVLEYKRMDKKQEKMERPQLLCAPFERKDMIGLDLESRNNRKKCIGRLKKHLADLSLQVGLSGEALHLYSQAADILKGCNDWLWLAACFEGMCSASILSHYPHMTQNIVLQRYSSLGIGSSFSSVKAKCHAHNTNSLPSGLDPIASKNTSKHCLTPDDIVEKYKEAIVHYSKYRNAGVVETEASIKAVHVLIEQRRHLLAAEFLSNVVFINLQLSDEEKISRFNALSDLYHQIGFHRKASFFRRVAAMRCVAPQNENPDWAQCYRLLLLTMEGYKLTLDQSAFVDDGRPGWPALQIQILQELVGTSKRMNEDALCTRHQAFLVSAMLPHFTQAAKKDTFAMLEAVSTKAPSANVALVVPETGIIVPPVNFMNIPLCKSVKVLPPTRERNVEKRNDIVVEDPGPFIFSPFTSLVTTAKVAGRIEHSWVEGDVCEVVLGFDNPMRFPLKMTNMVLLTEGANFESWTSTILVGPEPITHYVSLRGRPQEAGELRIIGYSACVGGVSSNCRFKSISYLKVPFYSIDIVPALPCVQILCNASSASENSIDESKNSLLVNMNAGETQECNIVIHNISSQPVDSVEVEVESPHNTSNDENKVFEYCLENLNAQLPIQPGGRASLTLYVYAASEFLLPGFSLSEDDSTSLISGSEPPSLLSTGPSSLPSRQSTVMSSLRGQKHRRSIQPSISGVSSRSGSSLKSHSSGSSTGNLTSHAPTSLGHSGPSVSSIDGQVIIRYTGGKGLADNIWRIAEMAVKIEVVPSLLVTKWDAIPSEMPHQCYIVLDLLNSSSNEMDLQYTPSKHILIQGGESCRVPVPVDRCPISKLNKETDTREIVYPPMGPLVPPVKSPLGEHVSSLIDLRWTLNEVPGRASLKGITFPHTTHHLLTMAPIHWDVQLNGEVVNGGTDNSCCLGDIQNLIVGVSNASGAELPALTVVLNAFQDHQNGSKTFNLEARFSSTGSNKFNIPKLEAEESCDHEFGLVFFTSGVYKVEVSCVLDSADSKNPIYHNTNYLNSSGSDDSLYRQTWKLAPPIEITVIDN